MKDTNEKKEYCMNCNHYNFDYGYCANKDSDYYQLEMRYDEVCSEHECKDF